MCRQVPLAHHSLLGWLRWRRSARPLEHIAEKDRLPSWRTSCLGDALIGLLIGTGCLSKSAHLALWESKQLRANASAGFSRILNRRSFLIDDDVRLAFGLNKPCSPATGGLRSPAPRLVCGGHKALMRSRERQWRLFPSSVPFLLISKVSPFAQLPPVVIRIIPHHRQRP